MEYLFIASMEKNKSEDKSNHHTSRFQILGIGLNMAKHGKIHSKTLENKAQHGGRLGPLGFAWIHLDYLWFTLFH